MPDARAQRHLVAFRDGLRDAANARSSTGRLFLHGCTAHSRGTTPGSRRWSSIRSSRSGGLPLLTATVRRLTVSAWHSSGGDAGAVDIASSSSSSRWLRGATTIWSVRPQVFSIVMLPLVAVLAARDRLWLIPPLVAVWANLHMGAAIASWSWRVRAVAVLRDRERCCRARASPAATVGATLLTPARRRNWTETRRVDGPFAGQSNPGVASDADRTGAIAVLGAGRLLIWLLTGNGDAWDPGRPGDRHGRRDGAPLAVRTLRNVPAFMMLAAPSITRTDYATARERKSGRRRAQKLHPAASHLASVVAAARRRGCCRRRGVVRAVADARMAAGLRRRGRSHAELSGPLYNRYPDGGPLIWFVPSQRVFVDSRQDQYPIALVQAASRVEITGDYRALFDRWRINCAALPPTSPTVAALERDNWVVKFSDPAWVVLERPAQ